MAQVVRGGRREDRGIKVPHDEVGRQNERRPVAGCGRKANLDTPTQANYEREKEEAKKAGTPAPPRPSKETPDRRFILDGLID